MSAALPRVAVVGAATLIGEAVIAEIAARKLACLELHALDDQRDIGRRVASEEGTEIEIAEVGSFDFARADLVIFCGRAALSERYARAAADRAWVIDASSTFRAHADVPLIAADVNGGLLEGMRGERGLIALPGSASVALATVLAPLAQAAGLERVDVATYQAVSGSGRVGVDELARETVALLSGKSARGRAFGRQIAFNVIPQVEPFDADGISRQERSLWEETRRLLGLPRLAVNATAVRVPVFFGHSLAVHALLERPLAAPAAREVLQRGKGIAVLDLDASAEIPTPATLAMAPDRVYVGRIRADLTRDRALNFWVVADNVRKCAAHNAVSVAQILVNSAR